MIQVKKNTMITFVISAAFFLASASAIAEYSQTQNKIDDKQDKAQQSQSNTSSKKEVDKEKSGSSSSENRDHNTKSSTGTDKMNDSVTDKDKKGSY